MSLIVAMSLGLLVVSMAAAVLFLGQQGYRTVDATTQLRDRERFVTDLLTRIIVQAGFQDISAGNIALRSTASLLGNDPEPDLYGWNNAIYKQPDDLFLSTTTKIANGNRSTSSTCPVNDTSCKNGSDILVVRYQGVTSPVDANTADNTMINCAGFGERGLTGGDLNQRAASVFHVTRASNGEPGLSCAYYKPSSSAWAASAPIIEGIESFQLLFGTDQVSPGVAPSTAVTQDSVADRWLRADELTVPDSDAGTRENWRRVRAVRVGLVMRGPRGSAPQPISATFNPLGDMYTSSNDTGSALTVAADGRLRLQSTFTVHLRNDLTLR